MAKQVKMKRKVATVEFADGTIHTGVRIINPDVMRYGQTAEKHGWPHMQIKDGVATVPHINYEEPFTAWAALKRLELYAGSWEEFRDTDCVGLAVEEEDVDPTPAAETSSAAVDSSWSSHVNTQGSLLSG